MIAFRLLYAGYTLIIMQLFVTGVLAEFILAFLIFATSELTGTNPSTRTKTQLRTRNAALLGGVSCTHICV